MRLCVPESTPLQTGGAVMGRSGGGRTGKGYKGGRGYFIPVRGSGQHPAFGVDGDTAQSARQKRRARAVLRRRERKQAKREAAGG